MKKTSRLAAVILIISLCLTACFGSGGEGKDFNFPIDADPERLDPQVAAGTAAATVIASCFEGLVRLDENGAVVNAAAQSIETSADGRTYNFRIRDGAKWHLIKHLEDILGEGYEKNFDVSLKAQDFVFGIGRALSPDTASPEAVSLYQIKNAREVHEGKLPVSQLGVRAVNDKTLVIELESADDGFLRTLTEAAAMPCNQKFFEATSGKYGLSVDSTLCNGPFYLSKWTSGSALIMRANPDYDGDNKAVPSSVYLYVNDDMSSRVKKLTEGDYDGAPLGDEWADKTETDSGIALTEFKNTVWGLCFNCTAEPLDSAELRAALCCAFDRAGPEIPADVSGRAQGIIPPCCTVSGEPYRVGAGEAAFPAHDEARAKSLWKTAISQRGISKVTLTVLCTQAHETAMRRLIQEWQRVMGVSLAVGTEVVGEDELMSRVESGDYQIALAPVKASKSSAESFLESFAGGTGKNIFNYSSDIYDEILGKIALASTREEVVRGCIKAEAILIQNGVFMPFYDESEFFALAPNVGGIYFCAAGESMSFTGGTKTE